MTTSAEMPDEIWASNLGGWWSHVTNAATTRYIRADLYDAEIAALREQLEIARKRERANEDQLVRIAFHLGGDATNAPESDRTIAGFAIAEIERLRADLERELKANRKLGDAYNAQAAKILTGDAP